jgi:hypothetical protein
MGAGPFACLLLRCCCIHATPARRTRPPGTLELRRAATCNPPPRSASFYIAYPDGSGAGFAYLVGPGYYPDGTAHRDELSAGADDYYHVATPNLPNGTPQFPRDPYTICMGDDETVEDFAGRIAAQYAALTRDHHRDPITAIAGDNGTVCIIIPAADVDRIVTALDIIRQDDDTADDAERAAVVRAADDAHRAIARATT